MRASNLPLLAMCRCFESDTSETEFTVAGEDRHAALWDMLKGDTGLFSLLSRDDQDVIRDAASYLRVRLTSKDSFNTEVHGKIEVDGVEITATPDLLDPPIVFDLKSRDNGMDYTAQMAAYALMCMDAEFLDWCEVHIGYTIPKFYVRKLKFDLEGARNVIREIINAPEVETPNDFCHWCSKRITCPALNRGVSRIQKGREDWELVTYHPSQITDPEQMAKAKIVAGLISKWVDSVDFHASEMAKKGIPIPGFKIQEQNLKEIENLIEAFQVSHKRFGISSDQFMACCKLTAAKLIDLVAEYTKCSKAQAGRDVERALAPVTKLVPIKKLVKERAKKPAVKKGKK